MSNVYVEPRPTIKVPKLVEDDEHRPVNKPVDLPKPDPVKVDDPSGRQNIWRRFSFSTASHL